MREFTLNIKTQVGDGIYRKTSGSINGKEFATPAKAVPIRRLRDDQQIWGFARGIAEVYQEVNARKLREYQNHPDTPQWIDYFERKFRHLEPDEIRFTFFGLEEADQITPKDARLLVELSETYSDVITVPLQPEVYRAIDGRHDELSVQHAFQVYQSNVELFLEAVENRSASKPVLGVVPLASTDQMDNLIAIYEAMGVQLLGVNLDRGQVTTGKTRDRWVALLGLLGAYRIFENYLMYAINPAPRGRRRVAGIAVAEDFSTVPMGFDLVGEDHVGLGRPIEAEQQHYQIFDPDVAGYRPVAVDDPLKDWPVTVQSGISKDDLASAGLKRGNDLARLISVEQLSQLFGDIRDLIDTEDADKVINNRKGIDATSHEAIRVATNAYTDATGPNLA